MPPSPEDARRLLCALGEHVRDLVVGSRGMDMAAVTGETVADTIYAVDRVADDALLQWFDEHWRDVVVVSEGLDEPAHVGRGHAWTVIVDTIDGTRGLMYDKRPAWCLAAAAPPGGGLADIVAAAMTELPTAKQGAADQLSATRGGGLRAERVDLARGGRRRRWTRGRPWRRTSVTASAVWRSSSSPARRPWPRSRPSCSRRLGETQVFDDQYLSTGGQLHELITGRDRFVADLRPLVTDDGLACHPYDVCTSLVLEEVGGVVTDPWGDPLAVPLDNVTPVAWVGYAQRGAGGPDRPRAGGSWWTNCVRGSAPGRLDLLGGVADYSGALVLEMPTRQRTEVVAHPADALVVGPVTFSPRAISNAWPASPLRHCAGSWPRARAGRSTSSVWPWCWCVTG